MAADSAGAKVLVVGLDGASPELVSAWAAAGDLPHLASLAERGHLGLLRSTPNYLSSSAWSTFVTGLQPGNHGIYYFRDRVPGTYRTAYSTASVRDGVPIWSAVSAAGKKVAGLFVPMTWPAVPVNGVLVSSWLAPSAHDPGFAYPRELTERILQLAPSFRLHSGMTEYVWRGNYATPLELKKQALRDRLEVAAGLLATEAWDLFVVVFHEPDPIQHFYWHFHDPNHPQHHVPGAEGFRTAIFDMYREADQAVGRLLEIVGRDSFVFVISDHGAGPNTRCSLFLKGLLRAHGFETPGRPSLGGAAARGLRSLARHLLPTPLRHRLTHRHLRLRERLARRAFEAEIDWSKTQAYTFWCGTVSEPWLNVRGRDPQGVVEPAACDEVASRVTEAVMDSLDPATREPAARAVYRRGDIYSGPHLDRAPDLLIDWRPDIVVDGLQMGCEGPVIDTPVVEAPQTGDHRPDGVFVAAGPPGTVGEAPDQANIADLAPTIYGLLDVAPPHPLDGRAWTELFPGAVHVRPPERTDIASASGVATTLDTAILEKRLEDLGYL